MSKTILKSDAAMMLLAEKDAHERTATAARAMLAALVRVMAEADFGDETLATECNDAIAAAKAAGIGEE